MGKISELQYLAIGEQGGYANSGRYRSSRDQVDRIVAHIKAQQLAGLNLYFPGGLLSTSRTEADIQRVLAALDRPQTHTAACLWNTDLLTTLRENVTETLDTPFGRNLMKWVIRAVSKVISADGASWTGTGPGSSTAEMSLESIEREWLDAGNSGRLPFERVQTQFARK